MVVVRRLPLEQHEAVVRLRGTSRDVAVTDRNVRCRARGHPPARNSRERVFVEHAKELVPRVLHPDADELAGL
jgi:hypothetical protein